jgi:hypothetical protein
MNFKPVRFPQGYGMEPNITSWGGNAIFDGQRYHLFVAVMTNGRSLRAWILNSRVDHATSYNITGPYKHKDVAINTWSHNPAPILLPDGTYAIIHIGDGSGQPDGGENCSVQSTDAGPKLRQDYRYIYPSRWMVLGYLLKQTA